MAKLNVAIADDNERILTMLDEVLTADDDITVVGTARNGEQAYEMILDKKPDVVLLDLVMPGIDGLGVMDKVHAEKNAESMPSFIIISVFRMNQWQKCHVCRSYVLYYEAV